LALSRASVGRPAITGNNKEKNRGIFKEKLKNYDKTFLFDAAFILVAALVLLGINYAGGAEMLGKFSIVIALTGYF